MKNWKTFVLGLLMVATSIMAGAADGYIGSARTKACTNEVSGTEVVRRLKSNDYFKNYVERIAKDEEGVFAYEYVSDSSGEILYGHICCTVGDPVYIDGAKHQRVKTVIVPRDEMPVESYGWDWA